ncbi:hypothetical protein [Arthrobacter ruber]|uniref:hypothetical protein n=1 Tax=Arthrobacter ruber TaxID=1258893 RepID=UPI000CF572AE|nr:hypothetical protein [Arthrobacter ruber]
MTSLYVIPVSLMLILLGSLTFKRLTSAKPEGAAILYRRSGRLALLGILLTTSYVLLMPPVYIWMEEMLPLSNGTDLISKYCALLAVAFLGEHLSRAYNSTVALRWNVGTRGAIAIGLATVGLFATLVTADTPQPSPQLANYADQLPVDINTWIMLAYVAYVGAPLIRPTFRDARRNPLRIGRLGSALICTGLALSTLRALAYFPLELPAGPEAFYMFMLVSYISTACVVLGLWAFAFARRRQLPRNTLDIDLSIE